MKRLKILACAYTCSPTGQGELFGGGEDILGWNIVEQLSRFHDVTVLAHTRNQSSIEAFFANESRSNVTFHYTRLPKWFDIFQRVQGGIQSYSFIWQIWAYFVAVRLNKKCRFEAFHHITYANDWMASYIGALLRVPYIRGPGGGAHRTPNKFLHQYDFKGRMWERVRVIGQWLFKHDPFFLIGQSTAKALLVCNHEAFNSLPQRWKSKSHMFPVCGVSASDLSHSYRVANSDNTFRVLTSGKLLQLKGFAMAISAFAAFASRYPNTEFKIIGDGPEENRLKRLAESLEVSHIIKFESWMPRPKLLGEMAVADVFLFPSLRDGGGAVVIEAMAMGTPIVCLDISGPGMHVTDETGIKITASDPERSICDMAIALERLYLNTELKIRLGKAAKERVVDLYHWDRIGERLNDLYREIFSPEELG